MNRFYRIVILILLAVSIFGAAQSLSLAQGSSANEITLTISGFAVARDSYGELSKAFAADWEKKTGQKVKFEESFRASGALSRDIAGGFEADIFAAQLDTEIETIEKAKLLKHDWRKAGSYNGIATTSVVALAVRKGNPKQLKDWADLAKPGVEILMPNPATSGGARWNVLGLYVAAQQGLVTGYDKNDDGALKLVNDVLGNVSVLAKDGRENMLNFEKGVGDVAITYENEIITGRKAGNDYEIVFPNATILIQQPLVVIDAYVDKKGTRKVAEAFRDYVWSPEGQRIFAKYGFRPVDPQVAAEKEIVAQFPEVKNLFKIDDLGGWTTASKKFFSDDGTITKVIAKVKGS